LKIKNEGNDDEKENREDNYRESATSSTAADLLTRATRGAILQNKTRVSITKFEIIWISFFFFK
jgi:hypothetical protein